MIHRVTVAALAALLPLTVPATAVTFDNATVDFDDLAGIEILEGEPVQFVGTLRQNDFFESFFDEIVFSVADPNVITTLTLSYTTLVGPSDAEPHLGISILQELGGSFSAILTGEDLELSPGNPPVTVPFPENLLNPATGEPFGAGLYAVELFVSRAFFVDDPIDPEIVVGFDLTIAVGPSFADPPLSTVPLPAPIALLLGGLGALAGLRRYAGRAEA